MAGISLKEVELLYVHAESSLDDNLSAKGRMPLSSTEGFMRQFIDANGDGIYSKEFDGDIRPFGDSSLKWWNPIFTES